MGVAQENVSLVIGMMRSTGTRPVHEAAKRGEGVSPGPERATMQEL
jgi:hypothetical protein